MNGLPRARRALAAAAVLAATAAGAAAEPSPAGPPPATRLHTVVAGDTLWTLARRYGVTVPDLVTANRLAGPGVRLRPGRRLVIPPPSGVPAATRRGARGPGAVARRDPRAPRGLVLAVPDWAETAPFLWPADGPVSSPFGRRRTGWHGGIDIKAEPGTPILAAADGLVVASGWEPRYGRVVKIQHEQGLLTVYAHNEANLVQTGDYVPAGERVATVGRTGRATAPHLHFEVRRDGVVYNPLYLLPLPPRVAQVEEEDTDEPPHE